MTAPTRAVACVYTRDYNDESDRERVRAWPHRRGQSRECMCVRAAMKTVARTCARDCTGEGSHVHVYALKQCVRVRGDA